jgi:hypothetical protein
VPAQPTGVRSAPSNEELGIALRASATSASVASTPGSGILERVTSPRSARSNTNRVKVSPDRNGKKKTQRAKTTIAISSETISLNLDSLEPADRMLSLVEMIRRLTRRLETEAIILLEQRDALLKESST